MRLLLFVCVIAFPASVLAQEARPVQPFQRLVVHGAFNIFLRQGTVPSVRIEALPRLADLVQVLVQDSTLYVVQRHYVPKLKRFNVIVTYTQLQALQLVGGGDLVCEGPWRGTHLQLTAAGNFNGNLITDAHSLSLNLSGQGQVQLQGRADSLALRTSGDYALNNAQMRTQTIIALFRGLGVQQLGATRIIQARVSGAIEIRVTHTPTKYEVITLQPGQADDF